MSAPIFALWTKDDATKKGERLDLAVGRLRSRADGYLIECRQARLDAEAALTKAIDDAQKDPNFGKIVEARIGLKLAEKQLQEATETYAQFFGPAGI
jgi:hypothetical protein